MKRFVLAILATTVLIPGALCGPASASVTASADFETSIVPPFNGVQNCSPITTNTLSTDFVLQGLKSMKSFVSGKCSFGSQRAEALQLGSTQAEQRYTDGEERYFGFSVYFPSDFPATQEGHCLFMQLHSQERGLNGRSPAMAINCRKPATQPHDVEIRGDGGGCTWETPMVRDVWWDFVVRMKFSTSTATGNWDLWYGQGSTPTYTQVISNCAIAALLSSTDYGYLKVGLYRGLTNTDTITAYHDDVRVGTTFADVARGAAYIVNDTMTGTAGTSLTSHTGEAGATWTAESSYPSSAAVLTAAGRVRTNVTGAVSSFYASGLPPTSDYHVKADLYAASLPSSDSASVIGRVSTAANTKYRCRYSVGEGVALLKYVNGSGSYLGTQPLTLTAGSTYPMDLSMTGSSISCTVGATTVSATDSAITVAGRAGIQLFHSTGTLDDTVGLHIDNVMAVP